MISPRWARALIGRIAPYEGADDLIGDLEETHGRRVAARGRFVAWWLTALEVLDMSGAIVRERIRRRRRDDVRARGPVESSAVHRARPMRWPRSRHFSRLDVMLGLRMLRKSLGLTVVGGLGMAVAIAIGAGTFAFFHTHMYPNIPLDEGDRLVGLENWDVELDNENRRAYHDFVTWRNDLRLIEDVSAFRNVFRNLYVPGGATEAVQIGLMTASGFRTARVAPVLGRVFDEGDENEAAPPVLVIGYHEWRNRFAADADVIGRQVRIGSVIHTIVGVMPEGFSFPMNHRFWAPLSINPIGYARLRTPEIFIFGRLASGASMEAAQIELSAIGARTTMDHPDTHERLRPRVWPYTHPLIDIQGTSGWYVVVMQLIISLILAVVAVNVGVLAYARTARRRGEIAIRTALGASRARIVGQLFVEAVLLSTVAAVVGLGLAIYGFHLGNQILETELGPPAFWVDISNAYSAPVLLYVVGLTVLAATIIGVVPGLQATGRGLHRSLKDAGSGTRVRLGATWTGLIVAQVAIAITALPAAISAGWGEIGSALNRPTFETDRFLLGTLVLDADLSSTSTQAAADSALAAYLERYASLELRMFNLIRDDPSVSSATFASSSPGSGASGRIEVVGAATASDAPPWEPVRFTDVDVEYFETLGVRVLAGRMFDLTDLGDGATPVIVNQTFVNRALGGASALGRRLRYVGSGPGVSANPDEPADEFEIVGVVADMYANALDEERVSAQLYHPAMLGARPGFARFVIALRGAPTPETTARLTDMATSLDPDLRLAGVAPLSVQTRQQNLALRLVALILTLILAAVLLLSAAGIYALMSFAVTQRKKEIGIRIALGASRGQILGSVFRRSARQLGIGVAFGVVFALVLERLTGGEAMGGMATVLLPSISLLMILTGALASYGPARRGIRVQPMEVLRED